LPGGMTAVRLGPRRAVLVGLALMGLSSLGFALAGGFSALFAARLVQGAGSAFTWAGAFAWLLAAAPRERRGELIGSAMAAAVLGELLGPVIGTAAALAGRASVFSALAALAIVLAVLTVRLEGAPTVPASAGALSRALASRRFAGGLGVMSLASLLFGVIAVLAPLHLAAAGWGATAIGSVWLVGGALEAVESPLIGRLSDRRGPLLPVRFALGASALVSLALETGARPLLYAPLVVVGGAFYGALFTPAFALIADGAERVGLAQGMAFGMMNAAWAVGAMVGPAAGGAIAGAAGDWIPFVLAAGGCGCALAAIRGRGYERGAPAHAGVGHGR